MNHIALKMLFGDRGKYLMLVSGIAFSSLLMTQQASVFCGLIRWTTANVRNMRSPVWVVDPKVEQANEIKPMRDTDLDRVRSVDGVRWAVPLFVAIQQARLADGSFKNVQIIGLDSATLAGAPTKVLEGRLEDIYQSNAVIVDQQAIEKLSRGRSRPLALGDSFEINDREARIVAIVPAELSFTGAPNIYSTKERALDYIPRQRKMLSYVLATPQPGVTDVELAARISSQTQLKAYTEKEFFWATIWWYFKYTGIPISFGTTVTLGIIVGIVISGQTFYTFIQENMRSLGALKAMGMSNFRLIRMVLLQAFTVGFMGYGIGLGLACLYGNMSIKRGGQPPFFMPPEIPIGGAVIVFCICGFAALLGIIKVARLEPAIVFRG